MKGIADTGFLVAFANRNDAHHVWAMAVAEQADTPLLTCEAVLAEAAFHLRDAGVVF
jgi:predicted nucleic acid-binding protein